MLHQPQVGDSLVLILPRTQYSVYFGQKAFEAYADEHMSRSRQNQLAMLGQDQLLMSSLSCVNQGLQKDQASMSKEDGWWADDDLEVASTDVASWIPCTPEPEDLYDHWSVPQGAESDEQAMYMDAASWIPFTSKPEDPHDHWSAAQGSERDEQAVPKDAASWISCIPDPEDPHYFWSPPQGVQSDEHAPSFEYVVTPDAASLTPSTAPSTQDLDSSNTDGEACDGGTAESVTLLTSQWEQSSSQVNRQTLEEVAKHQDLIVQHQHEINALEQMLAFQGQRVSEHKDLFAMQEMLSVVAKAQQKSHNHCEDLLEDMLVLDSLSNLMPQDQALRKTVSEIKVLLNSLETTKAGLVAVLHNVRERLDTAHEELGGTSEQNGNGTVHKNDAQDMGMKSGHHCYGHENVNKAQKAPLVLPGVAPRSAADFRYRQGHSVLALL